MGSGGRRLWGIGRFDLAQIPPVQSALHDGQLGLHVEVDLPQVEI